MQGVCHSQLNNSLILTTRIWLWRSPFTYKLALTNTLKQDNLLKHVPI